MEWIIENQKPLRFSAEADASSFAMDTPEYGRFTFRSKSGITAQSLFAQFGDFSESLALQDNRKPHVSENGCELSLDAASPIPFGAEPKVERTYRFDGQSLNVATTFVLRHSFQMHSISAGGLQVSGPVAKIGITPCPETAGAVPEMAWQNAGDIADDTVIFDSPCPPLRFAVADEKGAGIEFELGETIWRWINAKRISGTCRYTVTKKGGAFCFAWQLYTFVPETPESPAPDGRDWRIQYKLNVLTGNTRRKKLKAENCKAVFDVTSVRWQDQAKVSGGIDAVCFSSAPALNALKKWVRQQFADAQEGDVFGIVNAVPHVCYSAAHMDRAKLSELAHWDVPALAEIVRWANRQLSQYGAKLIIL